MKNVFMLILFLLLLVAVSVLLTGCTAQTPFDANGNERGLIPCVERGMTVEMVHGACDGPYPLFRLHSVRMLDGCLIESYVQDNFVHGGTQVFIVKFKDNSVVATSIAGF